MMPQKEPASAEYPVIAYGDGSALRNDNKNPGPAGHAWCAKLPGGTLLDYQRHDPAATNIRQEMLAFWSFLTWLHPDQPAIYWTDSEHITKGVNERLARWQANGWRNGDGKPVAHRDLWEQIVVLLAARQVSVNYVKGHAGHRGNERANKLAGEAARDPKLLGGRLREVKTW